MKCKYKVVVVGLGVVGSASLWRLSCSEREVLGVDSGAPVNLSASSHGASRIFRRAYWEGQSYLPLLSQSDKLWRELDRTCSRHLIFHTGGLFIGPVTSGVVPKSAATAQQGNINHALFSAERTAEFFPAFHILEGMEAVYEDGAYTIAADDSKLHMLNLAVRNGAEVRFGTSVASIIKTSQGLAVQFGGGELVHTERVILSIGAALGNTLISDLSGLLQPKSVPVYWFKPKSKGDLDFLKGFPAFLYQLPDGRLLYGTPEIGTEEPGVKIGFHNYQQLRFDASTHAQPVKDSDVEQISACVEQIFPGLNSIPFASKKCIYTMSQDESFIIGESVDLSGVFYVSACSGHGFKFATGLGDVLARAALNGFLSEEVSIFYASRFSVNNK
ncbi:N-methyl-L-tryptophan oxidase [Pseudomonas sp. UW4]|uniref:N-methyl-L-tryptophan oxidase n=1 Tax=Pseudomonas sp. UW4 TaxID=1207075 RepID=UPI00029CDB55|nr:N-methyl-L-tryptophan oxidase [Pseudomonas sp. UW4]AFY21035.1 sarcosine oxidase [Pseudomonas sp. UW4]